MCTVPFNINIIIFHVYTQLAPEMNRLYVVILFLFIWEIAVKVALGDSFKMVQCSLFVENHEHMAETLVSVIMYITLLWLTQTEPVR